MDLTSLGSRNIGATNAFRVMGPAWGGHVFALDTAKGVLAALAPRWLFAGGAVADEAAPLGKGLYRLTLRYGFFESPDVPAALQKVSIDGLEFDLMKTSFFLGRESLVRARAAPAGMRGWHAGPIENSAAAEALTSILIQINRSGIVSHAGIKIVGQADH